MPKFADVIIPLAAPGIFTYALPERFSGSVQEGSRVVVPFGQRRLYTAIVARLSDDYTGAFELKDVADVLDERLVVLPGQLEFWKWIADYYMCTPGEVMKAALPAGLKMESETLIALSDDCPPDACLSALEERIVARLADGKPKSVETLQKELRIANLLPAVRMLTERGITAISEALAQTFRPRTERRVRLTPAFSTESGILDAFRLTGRAEKQQRLLAEYVELSEAAAALRLGNPALLKAVGKADLLKACGASDAILNGLVGKGILETYLHEVGRLQPQKGAPVVGLRKLSEAQAAALEAVKASFETHGVTLLHGVTSSGKTEVYTRLIQETLARGEQVLYLLPEIALTTQITSRLGRVFGEKMGVYHSKFPDAERVEVWQKQLGTTPYPLILGVRSALFLPYRNLGLIIVDEEHETSYKQQDPAPRYNARDAAIVLARRAGAKVLLGTATPSVETFHNTRTGRYGIVTLEKRFGDVMLPEVLVEDVKELRRKKMMHSPFSPRLTAEVRRALSSGEQAILFFNRRGYAPMMACDACGWTPKCTACDVSLTLHRASNKLVCHYCGASHDIPSACPQCEEKTLRDVGYGTEKIEAAVAACFPEARIARMDADTTRTRSAHERIISGFQRGETNLLIGTQMVTKGLDFDRVSVVGILNADQLLCQPDFRAFERGFQLMAQVAGRAGRRGKRGLVVLQTRQADLPVIRQAASADYAGMFAAEMEERETFAYPPFVRLIAIYVKHRDAAVADAAAGAMAQLLRPHFGDKVLGPDRPAVGRVQHLHIRKILLKVVPELPPFGVRRTLLAARENVLAVPKLKGANIFFDVDPF